MFEIKNISKTFFQGKPNEFKALNDISFKVAGGDMIAVVGKSGAGKSTLLHILACIDSFDRGGQYFFSGQDISSISDREKAKIRNKQFGIVFQDFALVPSFSVYENIEIPLILAGIKKRERKSLVKRALKSVLLSGYEEKCITTLSGGEKQRVAIARAIVNDPCVIFADEPTGTLDTKTGEEVFLLLSSLNKQGKTVIIITHDKEIAANCSHIIELSDGSITANPTLQ